MLLLLKILQTFLLKIKQKNKIEKGQRILTWRLDEAQQAQPISLTCSRRRVDAAVVAALATAPPSTPAATGPARG